MTSTEAGRLTPDAIRAAAVRALPRHATIAVDPDLRVLMAEGPALGIHGHDGAAIAGRLLAEVLTASSFAQAEAHWRRALAGETCSFEFASGDSERWYWVTMSPLRSDDEVIAAVALCQDVTEQRRSDHELREATAQFETAFVSAPIGMALVGLDGRFLRANAALCDITGYPAEELREMTFQDITHPDDLEADVSQLDALMAGSIESYSMDKRYFTRSGALIWVSLSVSMVSDDDGLPLHFVSQVEDISERRRMQDRLQELAERDPVTDLYNRRRFEDELERQVARTNRLGEDACLLVADIDDFKGVNDRYGHKLGDAALRAVARVMRQRLRATDVVARMGGDEFSVLLPGTDLTAATELAEELREAIAEAPIALGRETARITMSIGVNALGGRDLDPFVAADRAMYRAKAAGKDQVALAS